MGGLGPFLGGTGGEKVRFKYILYTFHDNFFIVIMLHKSDSRSMFM